MVLVLNSTPLIYLARVGLLELLGELPQEKILPGSVFNEVVTKGTRRGKPDALLVKKVIDGGMIEARTITDSPSLRYLLGIPGLHRADAEVLCLAEELKGTAIIDDEKARNVADVREIVNHGTGYLLVRFGQLGVLNGSEVRSKLDAMIRIGWRCSTEVYAEILKSVEIDEG